MRTLLLFNLLLCTSVLRGQSDSLFSQLRWEKRTEGFEINAEGALNSTAIPAVISNAFVFKQALPNKLKTNAAEHGNRLGGWLRTGFSYGWSPNDNWKNKGYHVGLSYSINQYYSLQFSENLWNIAMRGNAPYASQTLQLQDESFYAIQYQSIRFHLIKKFQNSVLSIAAGPVLGQSMNKLKLASGSIYTEPDGSFLDIGLQGEAFFAASGDNKLWKGQPSMGALLDLSYMLDYRKFIFKISAEDIGFIRWNKQSNTYQPDTAMRFTGIRIHDLFQGSTSGNPADSLKSQLLGMNDESSKTYLLPARFNILAFRKFTQKSALSLSFRQIIVPGFRPEKALTYHYSKPIGEKNTFGLETGISEGGFGRFHSFLRVIPWSNRHHYLMLGTVFNEGLVNPRRWSGNGILISYQWRP